MRWHIHGACTCGKGFYLERSDGWRVHEYGSKEHCVWLVAVWNRAETAEPVETEEKPT